MRTSTFAFVALKKRKGDSHLLHKARKRLEALEVMPNLGDHWMIVGMALHQNVQKAMEKDGGKF